jgi:ABC transporter substrate binding protein
VRRRTFITLFGGAAAAWPLAARAQQGERVRRIGVLMPQAESDPEQRSWTTAFATRLRELGWRQRSITVGSAAIRRGRRLWPRNWLGETIVCRYRWQPVAGRQIGDQLYTQIGEGIGRQNQVGGLMYYGVQINSLDQFQQAASYVDRILKGAKPGDLPIQGADKYTLVINLKVAKALGLTVPLPLIGLADEVIE